MYRELLNFIDMAKGNMLMNLAAGKLGSMVFYRAGGEQRTRTYVKTVRNPKTYSQIAQRSQLANIVNLYRVLAVVLEKSFADKKPKQSDYNAFVSRNLNKVRLYFTKEMAAKQACVVAPYQITSGSIATIELTGVGDDTVTNIGLGTGFEINEGTTVGEFSQAILKNNVDIIEGMALSYISVIQHSGGIDYPPTATANYYQVTIDSTSDKLLYSVMPEQAVAVVDGFLAHGAHVATGGFAWILSKKDENGKLQVSSQSLVVNDDETYTYYSSNQAREDAILSYGGQPDAFLTPGREIASQPNAPASVSSLSVGGKLITNINERIASLAVGTEIKINGTRLDMDTMSILISSSSTMLPLEQVVSQASPVATALKDATGSEVQVQGKIANAVSNVYQFAIVQGGRILYQYVIQEGTPDPLV